MNPDQLMVNLDDSSFDWQCPALVQNIAANTLTVLRDEASLTARLKKLSADKLTVEVIAENWVLLQNAGLRHQFGPVMDNHRFWSRHVVLRGAGKPWVLAHTLLPEHAAFSPLAAVMELQEAPLGEFLFQHDELRRMNLELAKSSDNLWGRRSLFSLYNKPIMVAEFFLPAFPIDVALTQLGDG